MNKTAINSPLHRSLHFIHDLCFDEDFNFTKDHLDKLVGPDEADFLISQSPDRRTLYRELVFESITSTIHKTYPLSLKYFSIDDKTKLFRLFLANQPVKSRHYRDIAFEFCDFVLSTRNKHIFNHKPVMQIFEQKPFLFDLFTYEKAWSQLTFMPDAQSQDSVHDLELAAAKPILNPALIQLDLEYSVHNFSDFDPDKKQTFLVLVRDPNTFEKSEFELNALGRNLLQHMLQNTHKSIGEICEFFLMSTHGTEIESVQSKLLGLIKTFIDHRIILCLQ